MKKEGILLNLTLSLIRLNKIYNTKQYISELKN